MATHGEIRWPPAGTLDGRLRGDSHGRRQLAGPALREPMGERVVKLSSNVASPSPPGGRRTRVPARLGRRRRVAGVQRRVVWPSTPGVPSPRGIGGRRFVPFCIAQSAQEGTMDPSNLGNRDRRSRTGAARRLRRLAAAAGVLVLAFALVLSVSRGEEAFVERSASDESAAAHTLSYVVEPAGAAAAEQTAQVLRERLSAAGLHDTEVRIASSAALTITAPAQALAHVTALVERGRVAIYDWERSVLGPRGAPAPGDANVTGGSDAGRGAAITRAQAETRAGARPLGHVVRAWHERDGWFALGGKPALTDMHIARAGSGLDPRSRQPIVTIEFTARGQSAFTTLTRTLAHRARARAADGVTDTEAYQHFAIVIDDQIVAVPYIDFRAAADGIDGSTGAQIEGGLTPLTARRTAAILSSGPLPAALSNPTGPPVTKRHP
jgi:ParB-like chromosome segregation protein Spo0J